RVRHADDGVDSRGVDEFGEPQTVHTEGLELIDNRTEAVRRRGGARADTEPDLHVRHATDTSNSQPTRLRAFTSWTKPEDTPLQIPSISRTGINLFMPDSWGSHRGG